MNPQKLIIPLIALVACKGGKDSDVCPVESLDIAITVNNTSGEPVEADEVVIDGEACSGSASSWTCTAVPGQPNQVTAYALPQYQPGTARALVDGPDCESVTELEIRMQVSVK